MYLSSPRNLPPLPHPTHISLPPSSPYPLPQLSTINWFVSGHSWLCIVRSDTKRASFLVGFLGTTRNEVVSFRISEKRETTKVVSTISALRCKKFYRIGPRSVLAKSNPADPIFVKKHASWCSKKELPAAEESTWPFVQTAK